MNFVKESGRQECPTPVNTEIQDTKSKRHSNLGGTMVVVLRKRNDLVILDL